MKFLKQPGHAQCTCKRGAHLHYINACDDMATFLARKRSEFYQNETLSRRLLTSNYLWFMKFDVWNYKMKLSTESECFISFHTTWHFWKQYYEIPHWDWLYILLYLILGLRSIFVVVFLMINSTMAIVHHNLSLPLLVLCPLLWLPLSTKHGTKEIS